MFSKFKFIARDGHLTNSAVAMLLDEIRGIRGTKLPETAEKHLDECFICKEALIDTWNMTKSSELKKGNLIFINPLTTYSGKEKKKLFKSPFVRVAAGLSLVVLISIIYLVVGKSNIKKATKPENRSSSLLIKKSEIRGIKSNFTAMRNRGPKQRFLQNPNLESMIGSTERGRLTGTDNYNVKIVPDEKIIFSWNRNLKKKIILDILDNKNNLIYSFKINGRGYELKKRFTHGLYYWKISDERHLYYIGKFIINDKVIHQKE